MFLKKIKLQNFMGFRKAEFDFTRNGQFKPISCLFAPNGTGKSSVLNAINLASSAPRLVSRDDSGMLFHKFVFDEDSDSTYNLLRKDKEPYPMLLSAVFTDGQQDKKVEINNTGVTHCDLEYPINYFIDADNQISLSKFQFDQNDDCELFMNMAKIIYNFPCSWDENKQAEGFYTDFIVEKYGVKVRYKRMSGGEKKIATMLSQICDSYARAASIIVIDSFEKEIFFKRQSRAVDQMIERFPNKQFFIVTHSETLINHIGNKYGKDSLYDLEEWKRNELGIEYYNN